MKSILLLGLIAGLALFSVTGCDDDDIIRDCFDCSCDPVYCERKFESLTEKWHVLNNIELSYTKRRIDKCEQLLDESFTFFLAAGDVYQGLPEQWDRVVEMNASTNLFAVDPPAPLPRCKGIELDIDWEDSNGRPKVIWAEVTGPGDETWYTTAVYYDFQFDIEPDEYRISNPGAKADFTIRNAGTDEAPHWQLVEMRDRGGLELPVGASSETSPRACSSCEQSTWGSVKAMYR
jgi:hypothetical protein